MPFIADTFNQKPKPNVRIKYIGALNDKLWYITGMSDIAWFFHKDGIWRDDMYNDTKDEFEYHDTKEQAIALAEKYNYIYIVEE